MISADPSFIYCDIEGGRAGFGGDGSGFNYDGVYQDNIDSNPLFVDADNNDFRLMDHSPCISNGVDSVEVSGTWYYVPILDRQGHPRPNPTGSSPDLGALESETGSPCIRYRGYVIDDTNGNNNGRANKGETVHLILTLQNTSLDATGITATITCNDPDIQIIQGMANFSDLVKNQSASNQDTPFTFSVSSSSIAHLSTLYLTVTAEGEYVNTDSFTSITGTATLLLVDDDGGSSYEVHYASACMLKQIYYEEWNVAAYGSPTYEALQPYKSVFWFTGDDRNSTLTAQEQTAISAFLDGGGYLILTGQNIGYDLVEDGSVDDSLFYSTYLHSQYICDSANTDMTKGVTADPITGTPHKMSVYFTGTFGGAGNQTAPDVISPVSPAEAILEYSPARTTAALRYEDTSTGARLIYIAFGFEGIAGPAYDTAAKLLENILIWLDRPTAVEKDPGVSAVPSTFVLGQNYPNPFNPTTTIRYSLPYKARVKVVLYDLLGREVQVLINREQHAGEYRITFDGSHLSSGIYFYEMQAQPERGNPYVEIKKLVLCK
jgi:hypothetical protein